MLRVEIIGNLGGDPEVRYTANGAQQTTFSVAVNSRKKDVDGEYTERTDWFRVRTMGAKAEYVQRFVKGQRVLVVGRLDIGEYTAKNTGEVKLSFDVWADEIVNLSPVREGDGQERPAAAVASNPNGRSGQPAGTVRRPADEMDDLPF